MTAQGTLQSRGAVGALRATDAALASAGRRIRIRTVMRYCGRALCWSAVPAVLAILCSKLHWFNTPSPELLAGFISTAVVVGLVLALTRPLTPVQVAKLTERRTDLKERLSSSIEFRALGMDEGTRFYGEQLADADRHASQIDMRAAFPIRIPWELPVGVLCALLVFLTFYLPTLPRFWSQQQRDEVAAVKKQGIQIEKVAKDAEKAADQQKLSETKKAAAEAKKLGEQMRKGKMTKKESLVALAKLTKHMEETQQRLAQPPAKKSLDEAHKDFQKALDKLAQDKEDAARKSEQLKTDPKNATAKNMKKPDEKTAPKMRESEAMKQMQQAMQQMNQALANQDNQQMQQAMQQMAQQMQKGELSKEEMKQMQQALDKLAQALKDTNQQEAADQMKELAQMMQQGAGDMDPNALQQMAAMMNQIGKMMGKGHGQMAMMDAKQLGELLQMLKDGRLTLAMGKGKGPGMMIPFKMPGGGKGVFGMGQHPNAMQDPGKTSPVLTAMGKSGAPTSKGKEGSAAEFAKYLAKTSAPSGHLPNSKVSGTRTQNGNELHMTMTGDPQAAKSASPYYQVVQTSKKQAESTLDKENIPASLKKQVKDYFDTIKP